MKKSMFWCAKLFILENMGEIPLALQPPNPDIRIRPVLLSDCVSLHNHCWPERSYDTVYRFIARVRQNAVQGRGIGVVCLDVHSEVRGFGQFTMWPRCGEISDLIVAEGYRSQGLGTAIIQYLTRSAYGMHADCVEIGAMMRNTGAVALYRRLGFADSHTDTMITERGKEQVLYLRIKLR